MRSGGVRLGRVTLKMRYGEVRLGLVGRGVVRSGGVW